MGRHRRVVGQHTIRQTFRPGKLTRFPGLFLFLTLMNRDILELLAARRRRRRGRSCHRAPVRQRARPDRGAQSGLRAVQRRADQLPRRRQRSGGAAAARSSIAARPTCSGSRGTAICKSVLEQLQHSGQLADAGLLEDQLPVQEDLPADAARALLQRRRLRRQGARRQGDRDRVVRRRGRARSSTCSTSQQVDRPPFQRAELDCTTCHVAAGTRNVPGVLVRSIFPTATGTQAGRTPAYLHRQ